MRTRCQTFDVRVGKRAQVVIPAALRKRLGVHEGDILQASVDDAGNIVLKPVPSDPLERLRKAFAKCYEGVDAVAYVRALREEWDR